MRRLTLVFGVLLLAAVAASFAAVPTQAAGPSLTLSVGTGAAGTPVTITGTGFPPGEIVALYIDSPGPYLDQPGPRADGQGGFSKAITWPDKTYDASHRVDPTRGGTHTVCGDTGYPGSSQTIVVKACAQFVVTATPSPSASPAPSTALVGPPAAAVAVVFAILLVLGAILIFLMRRAR